MSTILELHGLVHKLHEQVASLLLTSDGIVSKLNWKPLNNVAVTGSHSIHYPTYWCPTEAHRFYVPGDPGKTGLLCYVAVLMANQDPGVKFEEALFSSGCIDFGIGKHIATDEYQYSYSKLHLFAPERKDDGTLVLSEAGPWAKSKVKFQRIVTRAVPLSEVTDSASLEKQIVETLEKMATQIVEKR